VTASFGNIRAYRCASAIMGLGDHGAWRILIFNLLPANNPFNGNIVLN
jgi:hypothetical protein